MKIAVFGRTGQVATELQRRAPAHVTLQVFGREEADFAVPDDVFDVARRLQADAVINAAAYTAVDRAESETNLHNAVNGASVKALAQACALTGIPLLHLSTDYVFPGDGARPWRPDDRVGPLGAYGRSKLLGETGIRETAVRHVILRTSWVFSAHGGNFVKSMLRLGAERARLSVVADQVGGPTPASGIADACFAMAGALAGGAAGGTYHFSGAPDVSWAEFAREIFRQAGLSTEVVDIPTSGYPTPAQRPLNSRLDCSSSRTDFGVKRPDWRVSLTEILQELDAH